jgi:tRNA uridine 5-carboxymethylaminomethyl modification enzyme
LGLATEERMQNVREKQEGVARIRKTLGEISVEPPEINNFLISKGSATLSQKQKISQLLLRPGIGLIDLAKAIDTLSEKILHFSNEIIEQAEIQLKYEVYIEKERELVSRMNQLEDMEIPSMFDYSKVQAISAEAREKLIKIKPQTLGQASRISGINPSDVQILMVYMGR